MAVCSKPEDCPKFGGCSAPVCPLDRKWRERVHLKGEAVCGYLREAGKEEGAELFAGCADEWIYLWARGLLDEVKRVHASLKNALKGARRNGSRRRASRENLLKAKGSK